MSDACFFLSRVCAADNGMCVHSALHTHTFFLRIRLPMATATPNTNRTTSLVQYVQLIADYLKTASHADAMERCASVCARGHSAAAVATMYRDAMYTVCTMEAYMPPDVSRQEVDALCTMQLIYITSLPNGDDYYFEVRPQPSLGPSWFQLHLRRWHNTCAEIQEEWCGTLWRERTCYRLYTYTTLIRSADGYAPEFGVWKRTQGIGDSEFCFLRMQPTLRGIVAEYTLK